MHGDEPSSARGKIADRQQDSIARTRQHLSFSDSSDAFAAIRKRFQHAVLGSAALQPEMLLQRFTRYRAFEVSSSRRKLENHRAPVSRDARFKLDNLHGPPRKVGYAVRRTETDNTEQN
ncbi:hypothetical protein J2776_005283 [Paraburkholderia caledonica]|uniref:Uncharacterized protein n=1 Tax=Paraburkholderia caledonica TaxID=134536 RepID=A0ABU1L607_9BURK|nr:hypothetical protein [Paraburkholderia caledonica]